MRERALGTHPLQVICDRIRFIWANRDREVPPLLCITEEQDVCSREHLDANPFNYRSTKIHAVMIPPFAALCAPEAAPRVTAECSAAQSRERRSRLGLEWRQGSPLRRAPHLECAPLQPR